MRAFFFVLGALLYTPTNACDAGVYYGAKCTSAKVKLTSLWPPSLTTLSFIILLNIVSSPVPPLFSARLFFGAEGGKQ